MKKENLQELKSKLQRCERCVDFAIEIKSFESDLPEQQKVEEQSIDELKKSIFELFSFLGIGFEPDKTERNFFQ